MKLKIVTWNIHRCFGTDRRYWPERVADAIRAMDADIVALQEVDSSLRVQGEIDQLSYLAQATGMKAVMGPTLQRDYGAYGNALLTRHAVVGSKEYNLSYRKFEPRGALEVRLNVNGVGVRIFNVHLGLKYWERAFQIEQLLGDIFPPESNLEPSIILGDFNEWFPFTPNQSRLKRRFENASPPMKTFPSGWPRFALDRIFASGGVIRMESEVLNETRVASDHLAVAASVEFAANMNLLRETPTEVCR